MDKNLDDLSPVLAIGWFNFCMHTPSFSPHHLRTLHHLPLLCPFECQPFILLCKAPQSDFLQHFHQKLIQIYFQLEGYRQNIFFYCSANFLVGETVGLRIFFITIDLLQGVINKLRDDFFEQGWANFKAWISVDLN